MPYGETLISQEHLVAKRSRGEIRDSLILPNAFPLLPSLAKRHRTICSLATLERLRNEGISICKTNRGGDITYHGLGQLVGYPILDLNNHGKDLHKYVNSIEEVLINLLEDYDIAGHRKRGTPGVWAKEEKIAAIGIAVKKGWISMYGFSFKIDCRLDHFSLIVPCGTKGKGVTSLRKIAGTTMDKQQVQQRLLRHCSDMFCLNLKKLTLDNIS